MFGPHAAALIIGKCRDCHTDHGVWRAVEHGAPGQFDCRCGHGLPVIGAVRGVLHHVDLLQVRCIGKGLVPDEELEGRVGVICLGISILEVDALDLRLTGETIVSDTSQMGVIGEEAHQVVQNIHLAVLGHALFVDRGSRQVVAIGVNIPAVFILIPTVCGGCVHVLIEIGIPVVIPEFGESYELTPENLEKLEPIPQVSKFNTEFVRLDVLERIEKMKDDIEEIENSVKEESFEAHDDEIRVLSDRIKEIEEQIAKIMK